MWLNRNGKFRAKDWLEHVATYVVYAAIYGAIIAQVGAERFLLGLIPATVLHAYLLWYPFAIMTHEGYSTGSVESRSHNYYGRLAYCLSFGLSLHRVHHQYPKLAWLEMTPYIQDGGTRRNLTFRRQIQTL
jgi:fatty acid desaturase